MPVPVVVAGYLPQLRERIEEVRRISTDEVQVRLKVADRLFGMRERTRGQVLHLRQHCEQVAEVIPLAGLADGQPQVPRERNQFLEDGTQFGEEGGQVLGRRLRRVDQRFEVVQRRPQVD